MPGLNVDPADSMNVLDVIRAAFSDAVTPLGDKLDNVTRAVLDAQSSPMHSTQSYALTAGAQPVRLLSYDRSRVRALLRASAADVFVGSLEQLQSLTGYPLPVNQGDEFKTIADIYVGYYPVGAPAESVSVFAWVERRV